MEPKYVEEWVNGNEIALPVVHDTREDVNESYEHHTIHQAVSDGNIRLVESLKKSGMDVDAVDSNGYTPLLQAVEHSSVDMVKYLLAGSAEGTCENHNLFVDFQVHFAKASNEEAILELILAFVQAICEGDRELIWMMTICVPNIITMYCNIELVSAYRMIQGFIFVTETKEKMIDLLVKNKADIDRRTPDKETPISITIRDNEVLATRLLLEYGAKTTDVDGLGNSALNLAAEKGNPYIAKMLYWKERLAICPITERTSKKLAKMLRKLRSEEDCLRLLEALREENVLRVRQSDISDALAYVRSQPVQTPFCFRKSKRWTPGNGFEEAGDNSSLGATRSDPINTID